MSVYPDYVEGLITKKLFLLAMTFEKIDDSSIAAFKYDISSRTGVAIDTVTQVYKLSQPEVEKLLQYEKDDSERILSFLDGQLRKSDEIAKLYKEKNYEQRVLYVRYALAGLLLAAALAYVFAITFLTVPESNGRFADGFGGLLIGCILNSVVAAVFGINSQVTDGKKAIVATKPVDTSTVQKNN